MKNITIDILGMHCASCSTIISRALNKVEGVKEANVNLTTHKATVIYDNEKVGTDLLISTIKKKRIWCKH